LNTLGHAKDSLWSIDLFRCESILLRSHWVLVVMDQYSRSIIGFGVHEGEVDGKPIAMDYLNSPSQHNLVIRHRHPAGLAAWVGAVHYTSTAVMVHYIKAVSNHRSSESLQSRFCQEP
jgi:hypothetical protein